MDNEQRIAGIKRRAKEDVPPKSYRIFWLDDSRKIIGSDIIYADDDAAAIEIANGMEGPNLRELWDADRLIARLPTIAG